MQAKAKLPSTAFTLNTSCSSYSGSERRQASLKRHVGLARGGLAFALFFFLLSYIFHFPAQVKINLPSHVKALKYLHIVIVKPQMKTVFAQVVGYFFCLFFFFFLSAKKERFLRASPEHVGSCRDVTNSRKNTCSNQLSITTATTPSAAPLASTADDGSGSARLTLPTECHVNCPAADAVKTRHLGTS